MSEEENNSKDKDALTLARKAGKAMTKAEDALSALADMDAPGAGELGGRAQ